MFKFVFAAIFALAAFCSSNTAEGAENSPNFIVFLTDDQGWGDLGCYGHPIIQSPNLDKFASEGLRLTQCYAACSVCSPSRSAILTGRTPYRNGVWRWIPGGSIYHLRDSEITITSLLKKRGYETCHAGKWHLNGKFNSDDQPQPDDHGYDHWLATQNNASPNHMNPINYVRNGEAVGRMEGPSAVIAADEAINWLKDRKDSETPFFITVWTHEPHLPIESAPQCMKHYAEIEDEGIRQHHGNITQLDDAFGKLMSAVDDMGYRNNTVVFYTSDNGPEGNGTKGRTRGSTGGLRGRKRATHEGGIRVPGIVRWPGKIKAGSVSETPVIGSDIFPTICDVLDIPLPTDRTIDGTSLLPLFAEQSVQREQPLYWRNHLAPTEFRVGMRVGDWKIVGSDELRSFELYNIEQDWQETTDVSNKFPEKFAAMQEALIKHDAEVLAEGPDWWKLDQPKQRKKSPAVEPPLGKDTTGDFDVVRGSSVMSTDFGYRISPEAEGIALQKLDDPIVDQAIIQLKYRSTQQSGVTRNGALVLASEPTNESSFKIGTAIGMNRHVAFEGGWANVGNAASTQAVFKPDDTFEITVSIDLSESKGSAEINGTTVRFTLPSNLESVQYVGFYAKATSTEFTAPLVE
ncbi:sulfatase-like hydrolase/transferase [Rhodopirellula sp. JC740]|uniref:Sulfatase-like hydrolase/transferase n=1 Tax=Rhodopirellula halodulae TaxID=2894198 RepID=A0ABS8NGF1_9BACT|nr:sulfatase-like hydrolase/transferase [Rhodopirellula sp. JC740]MCC9642489.1 sulfatase-like hydrolase/transferase [Rhodopirellula sp. JC740]